MNQNENESDINNNYNENGSNLEYQKPFMPLENINQINDEDKKELMLNGMESNQSEDFVSLSAESNSKKSFDLLNAKLLYEKSKKQLEPYQSKMIYTIKNIEEMVKNGEQQRNYKMKSEFEREKEYKLEEQSDIKNQIEELSRNKSTRKFI